MPTLNKFLRDGYIGDIILNIIENGKLTRRLSMKHDRIDLPLWRRNWHPLDGSHTKNSFVQNNVNHNDWDKWRLEPIRPYITYCKFKDIIKLWKRTTKVNN